MSIFFFFVWGGVTWGRGSGPGAPPPIRHCSLVAYARGIAYQNPSSENILCKVLHVYVGLRGSYGMCVAVTICTWQLSSKHHVDPVAATWIPKLPYIPVTGMR